MENPRETSSINLGLDGSKADVCRVEITPECSHAENLLRLVDKLKGKTPEKRSLSETARVIRDIVVEDYGFDRAGVFSYDATTETMRGTWGTDSNGLLEDISTTVVQYGEPEREKYEQGFGKGRGYYIRNLDTAEDRFEYPAEMRAIRQHAVIYLYCRGELLGYVAIDNLLTNRPIDEPQLVDLLAFVDFAALAMLLSGMKATHENVTRRQMRVMEITLAITSNTVPEKIYLMVRNAILEIGFVDRAAVWVVEDEIAHGTWGTGAQGELLDESHASFPFDIEGDLSQNYAKHGKRYLIDTYKVVKGDGQSSVEVPHAFIPLLVEGKIIGFVSVDNLLTNRKITPAMLEAVLLITDQAAVAIQTVRLSKRREVVIHQQKRLLEIAVAIAENANADSVYRLVRDAILETKLCERVAIWQVDGRIARGTWGTDEFGKPVDEHKMTFPLDDYFVEFSACLSGNEPYCIDNDRQGYVNNVALIEKVPYAVIPLIVEGQLVGILTLDTFVSKKRLTPENLEVILPLAKHATIAVQKSMILENLESVIQNQKKLMEISVAIAANADLDAVYLMVRDAILETNVCERAGVWLTVGSTAHGTWGTDKFGKLVDEHNRTWPLDDFFVEFAACLIGDEEFAYDNRHDSYSTSTIVDKNVPYAVIPLKAEGRLIGILTLDNVTTKRPFTRESLETILPLAKQAALAVHNSRILMAANKEINIRREVESLLVRQTEELTVARDDALAGARVKSEFLANMSHEIRTPMNGVLGLSSMLMETSLAPQQRDYLRGIQKSAEALLSVIDDILDISRLEAGMLKINRFPFNLRDCIEDVTELMTSQLKKDEVELNCFVPVNFPERLYGDGDRLRQMITNLVGNAVKFTEQGSVTVKAKCVSETAEQATIEIEVIDTGIGIAEERRSAVFESFTQADGSSTRRHGGSGLGLTITKQIVELMGGTIDLETRLGAGSTFSLQITFEKQVEDLSTQDKTTPLKGSSILILIENPIRRRFLADYALAWGCDVVEAESGKAAASASAARPVNQPFDFIILDGENCDVSSDAALAQLRSAQATARSRTLLLKSMRSRRRTDTPVLMQDSVALAKPVRMTRLLQALISLSDGIGDSVVVEAPVGKQQILAGMRVLLAEDNAVNAMVASSRLDMWGSACVCASNGLEVLKLLESEEFDVVLMDVSMPEMDGIHATREIRKLEEQSGQHLPIIAMTAHALQGDREKCLTAGMDDYISKPINFTEMLEKLRKWGRHKLSE